MPRQGLEHHPAEPPGLSASLMMTAEHRAMDLSCRCTGVARREANQVPDIPPSRCRRGPAAREPGAGSGFFSLASGSHSNVWFVKAYPRETTEAFLDGHVSALAFLGGVPRSILYDNTTLAVARILVAASPTIFQTRSPRCWQ